MIEAFNQGTDTVLSSLGYNLNSNIENLILTGTANINGTGNSLNNVLTGNNVSNTLDGGSGHDALYGEAGHDVLIGGSGHDALHSGTGHDSLDGGSGDDTLTGHSGNDILNAGSGHDTLDGGEEQDRLDAGSGDDSLTGGNGNDVLMGGSGHDAYWFNRGDGHDTIQETSGTADSLHFGASITPLDLMLSRQADDLHMAVYGSNEAVTIENWYTGSTNQMETLQAGNGQRLLNTQVQSLIQAMATFSTQTGLTWEQAIAQRPQDVQMILAANWQS